MSLRSVGLWITYNLFPQKKIERKAINTGVKYESHDSMKEYFQTEDEKVYFFEPLEKEISVEDMQKIVDANEKLVKELQHERDSSNKRR